MIKMESYKRAYAIRNQVLRGLGYASYREYLTSPKWRAIHAAVMTRDKHKCFGCGKDAQQVHHDRYTKANLSGNMLDGMYSVCRICHHGIEFDNGEKLSPQFATIKLRSIRFERLGGVDEPKKTKRHCNVNKRAQYQRERERKALTQNKQEKLEDVQKARLVCCEKEKTRKIKLATQRRKERAGRH